ncbi:metalloregulator ArsR/SmtB family transcription factor [Haliea sp. E17]|uniref:metalloregulator ArsR/SmtB family transcription factor n=1 Tax=Haliea sp. E17 TaxID=3401576 RepID=UPI003AABF7AB
MTLAQPALAAAPDTSAAVDTTALAALCKASGDPLRLQVLRVLREDSFGVMELCSIFELRQPALSHHLKVLANAGLVATRREGNSIFYRRALPGQAPGLEALQAALFETVDQVALPDSVLRGLRQLQGRREENSRSFFRDNADKFREQQDLIASYDQYAGTVAEVLAEAPLPGRRLALEVGPGDGRFLLELAPRFERVVALDIESAMLEQARVRAEAAGLDNVEFLHGDTVHPALQGLAADCVVINMVLHHTPDPGAVLADIAGCLAPKGVLLVTDLCAHDQGWARENCGDLWLGFDPAQLASWAAAAGLAEVGGVFLAQRNGFQVQVRLFGHRE